jgi:hypothetical protein
VEVVLVVLERMQVQDQDLTQVQCQDILVVTVWQVQLQDHLYIEQVVDQELTLPLQVVQVQLVKQQMDKTLLIIVVAEVVVERKVVQEL